MIHVERAQLPGYTGKAKYFLVELSQREVFGVYAGGRVIRASMKLRRAVLAAAELRTERQEARARAAIRLVIMQGAR